MQVGHQFVAHAKSFEELAAIRFNDRIRQDNEFQFPTLNGW
jgi:hypothetical protein